MDELSTQKISNYHDELIVGNPKIYLAAQDWKTIGTVANKGDREAPCRPS